MDVIFLCVIILVLAGIAFISKALEIKDDYKHRLNMLSAVNSDNIRLHSDNRKLRNSITQLQDDNCRLQLLKHQLLTNNGKLVLANNDLQMSLEKLKAQCNAYANAWKALKNETVSDRKTISDLRAHVNRAKQVTSDDIKNVDKWKKILDKAADNLCC